MILLAVLVRIAIAIVFLRAGLLKLFDVAGFRQAVGNYRLMPDRLVLPASLSVLGAELAGGGMLLVGAELRPVSIALAALLTLFCCAIAINLMRGRVISCGCSGSVASDISWGHVTRNAVLAAAGVLIAVWAAEPLSVLPGSPDGYETTAWAHRAIAVVLLVTVLAAGCLLATEARRVRRALSKVSRERAS